MTVGHSRPGTVPHDNIKLLPWCAWHHHRLRRHWSGVNLISVFTLFYVV